MVAAAPQGDPVAPGPAANPTPKVAMTALGKLEVSLVVQSPGVAAVREDVVAVALIAAPTMPMEFALPRLEPAVMPMVGPRGGGGMCNHRHVEDGGLCVNGRAGYAGAGCHLRAGGIGETRGITGCAVADRRNSWGGRRAKSHASGTWRGGGAVGEMDMFGRCHCAKGCGCHRTEGCADGAGHPIERIVGRAKACHCAWLSHQRECWRCYGKGGEEH